MSARPVPLESQRTAFRSAAPAAAAGWRLPGRAAGRDKAAVYRGSRNRLTEHALGAFPSERLFDRIARAVCKAGVLPRKELFESWEVARRVRRRFRGGRIVDLAAGHGLLAHILLILDDRSPSALIVDRRTPKNAERLSEALVAAWPRLDGRIARREVSVADMTLQAGDTAVCVHGCGLLTDAVLQKAIEARCKVAVLPCCHALAKCDTGGLEGWMDGALAIDATRAAKLRAAGYRVRTQNIPDEITEKNRLLMADPAIAEVVVGADPEPPNE